MPKKTTELTALEVKNLKNGTYAVGGVKGLYIRKSPAQNMFFLRYSDATGRHDFSLGSYPALSLAQARKAAFTARELIDRGESPIELRRKAREEQRAAQKKAAEEAAKSVLTFEAAARAWIADRAEHGYWAKNPKGEKETLQILAKHVFPVIGADDIELITPRQKVSQK